MAEGKLPRAYVNDVPKEGSDPVMEYVPFDVLGIGARKSGMPKGAAASSDKMNLDHVGGSAGKR